MYKLKNKLVFDFFILIILAVNLKTYSKIELPEFDPLMSIQDHIGLSSVRATQILGHSPIEVLNRFKEIYQKNRLDNQVSNRSIPKIIHQIWLGSPFPEKFKYWQNLIKRLHPGWQYILWTDKTIKSLKLKNMDLYNHSKNFGQKSDILRYEILNQFGGVYLDVDIECMRSFDDLNENFDFYAALEPLWPNTRTCLSVGNCVIASVPDHPILQHCINKMRKTFFVNHKDRLLNVVISTGPVFFTKACYAKASKSTYKDIILPSAYFFPIGQPEPNNFYAYCRHHWTHSWLKRK